MIRTSHRALFQGSGGRPPVITELWALNGWRGTLKGNSENSQPLDRRVQARLQKCALTLLL